MTPMELLAHRALWREFLDLVERECPGGLRVLRRVNPLAVDDDELEELFWKHPWLPDCLAHAGDPWWKVKLDHMALTGQMPEKAYQQYVAK